MLKLLFCVFLLSFVVAIEEERFAVNILHYNDFHARFVETNLLGNPCMAHLSPCIGGFARLATAVREAIAREPSSILLNAGDSFQGTFWYSLLRWNVTQKFMNMIPHDAHVLGNHEFGHGIDGLVPYLKHLNAPVVTANIIDDEEPRMQGLYKPSIVIERDGRKIGIIGVILETTHEITNSERLIFTNAVEAVKREAEKLNAEGVKIIIVLSHCGIRGDREIALNAGPHIDVIVGGHTHILMNNERPPINQLEVYGPYPYIVEQGSRKIPIVHAGAYALFLGQLKLHFDKEGNLLDWSGDTRHLNNAIEQAPDVMEKIREYSAIVEAEANRKLGSTMVELSDKCRCEECTFGNFICDSYMHGALLTNRTVGNNWHRAHFCVINRGAIRSSIRPGEITFQQAITAQPFENDVEVFELRGDHVLEMLEFSVANTFWNGARMLQMSGIRPVIDGSRPRFQRVLSVSVRCIECDVPRYEPLDPQKYYSVVASSFLGGGGDGFSMISENRRNVQLVGIDYDITLRYIKQQSPIFAEIDGRIQITNACSD